MRHCSKPGCNRTSVATLTYDYKNSTAVLGPLATTAEPHTYDLCENHALHLTVPKGWEVVRLQINYDPVPPSDDDLMALVEAVRQAAAPASPRHSSEEVGGNFHPFAGTGGTRSRLNVIAGTDVPMSDGDGQQTDPPKGPF